MSLEALDKEKEAFLINVGCAAHQADGSFVLDEDADKALTALLSKAAGLGMEKAAKVCDRWGAKSEAAEIRALKGEEGEDDGS